MYFRRPQVNIREALLSVTPCNEPAFAKAKRTKGPKRYGLIYQSKASEKLLETFPSGVTFGQWFQYRLKGAPRDFYCQVDAILVDRSVMKVTAIEMKLKHCADAFYQLFELYLPILEHYYGEGFTFAGVEMVSAFDRSLPMPQTPKLLKNISEAQPKDFSVHIWAPWRLDTKKSRATTLNL